MSHPIRSGPACPGFEDLLGYVHRELPSEELQVMEAHMQSCAACAEEVRIMGQIGNGLGQMSAAEAPPAGLRERILERVSGAPAPRRKRVFGWLEAVVTLACVAIVAAIIFPIFSQPRFAAKSTGSSQSLNRREMAYGGAPAPAASAPASPDAEASAGGGRPATIIERARGLGMEPSPRKAFVPQPYGAAVTPDDVQRYVRGDQGDLTQRRVVQTADFALTVRKSLEDAEKELIGRVQGMGGYVEQSHLVSGENGDRTSSLTIRVPVDKFEETVGWLPSLGEVKSKNVRGEDVTGRWIDERAEVRELRAEEARLLKQFNAAKTPEERESARWALVQLRGRIRASEERFAATAKMAALATLNVSLTQTRRGAAGAGLLGDMTDTFGAALGGFMLAVRVPLALLVWVIVFAPLWLPGVLIWRSVRRARERGMQ